MTANAFVSGCEGLALSPDERSFFRAADPWGLILFQRNCSTRKQVLRLTSDFRDCVGRTDAPVFIDQEGGRVQRLKPPHWRSYPSGAQMGAIFQREPDTGVRVAFNCARLIANDLRELGITVNCAPVLDVRQPETHKVIGDRAYASEPDDVGRVGVAIADGLLGGGVLPVIKHIPGHGRAMSDSHLQLPIVGAERADLEAIDFVPFVALNSYPIAMTAHIVYEHLDPERPATQSTYVIQSVIREELDFDGLLLTDDLNMNALSGTLADRARSSFEAGCDVVLHCSGRLDEMEMVAQESVQIDGNCASRAARALALMDAPGDYDVDEAQRDLDLALLESV